MIVLIVQIRRASEAGNSLSLFCVSTHVNQAWRRIHEGFTMLRKTSRSFAVRENSRFREWLRIRSSAHKMHNFQLVAILQLRLGPPRTGHNFSVEFDRHAVE